MTRPRRILILTVTTKVQIYQTWICLLFHATCLNNSKGLQGGRTGLNDRKVTRTNFCIPHFPQIFPTFGNVAV